MDKAPQPERTQRSRLSTLQRYLMAGVLMLVSGHDMARHQSKKESSEHADATIPDDEFQEHLQLIGRLDLAARAYLSDDSAEQNYAYELVGFDQQLLQNQPANVPLIVSWLDTVSTHWEDSSSA